MAARKNHNWTEEDETLALDLYFRVENPSAGHGEILKTAALVGCTAASMNMKLMNFRNLHKPESGLKNIAPASRQFWAKYCHDEKWLQMRLKKTPAPAFTGICRDIEKLRQDAAAIIKKRTAQTSRRKSKQDISAAGNISDTEDIPDGGDIANATPFVFINNPQKIAAPERRRWTEEDDILILDLYFRVENPPAGNLNIIQTAGLVGCLPETVCRRLENFRNLNVLAKNRGMEYIARLSRKIWTEYCHDKKWLQWRLAKTPAPVFSEACRDIEKLRRDAAAVIKKRTPPDKISRREARQEAMRILYAAALQNISAADSFSFLGENQKTAREKMLFADSLLRAIIFAADKHAAEISEMVKNAAGRAPELISGVELAVLRVAAAEILEFPRTKNAVIINEAVEIAKQFGAEGGHKIVNGALDKIAAQFPDGARADA